METVRIKREAIDRLIGELKLQMEMRLQALVNDVNASIVQEEPAEAGEAKQGEAGDG